MLPVLVSDPTSLRFLSSLICSGNQGAGDAGGAWLSSTIAVQVWLATIDCRLDGTGPWASLSLPGIRVGALALLLLSTATTVQKCASARYEPGAVS